jgi:hypothetical protein
MRPFVAAAIALTVNTPLIPELYERQLLARYQAGEVSIDHVLYRSRAQAAIS